MALQLNSNQVNYLNIGLMLLSALLAFLFPFELFLLVYAVLGPLHYLTEISWLHDKNYYTRGKGEVLFLIGASVAVTFIYFGWVPSAPKGSMEFLTAWAFLGALLFVLVKGKNLLWLSLLPGALVAFLFCQAPALRVFFGMFLPTLVHVFLFTGLFILLGALRGKSFSGLASLGVFAALAACFFLVHPAHPDYQASDYVQNSYGTLMENGSGTSPFIMMNYFIAKSLQFRGLAPVGFPLGDAVKSINYFLYHNPAALALMSFVAFAYTYHYLNWFSKTSIIGWNRIPCQRAWALLGLWGLSLALYAYNYSLGLQWLFYLSFAHVLLEFPLNQLTLLGIGRELRKGGSRRA